MSALAMSGEPARAERLSRAERMELTWVLAWPCLLFALAYDLFRQAFQFSEAEAWGLDTACGMLSLFLVSPWVVRRTVRLELSGFHLLVVRWGAPEGTRAMNYRESLSVTWLICWRTCVISIFIWLAFSALLQQRMDLYSLLNWLLGSVSELAIFYFWIVQAALDKNYAGFSLRLVRLARLPVQGERLLL